MVSFGNVTISSKKLFYNIVLRFFCLVEIFIVFFGVRFNIIQILIKIMQWSLILLEFDGEAISVDSFDFQQEANTTEEAEKCITTRVVIGIHENTVWETIKKGIQELHHNPATVDKKDPQSAASNTNYNHNLLVQTAQTQSSISRLDYVNSPLQADYYCREPNEQVKLCCKVLVFDFNFNILKGLFLCLIFWLGGVFKRL